MAQTTNKNDHPEGPCHSKPGSTTADHKMKADKKDSHHTTYRGFRMTTQSFHDAGTYTSPWKHQQATTTKRYDDRRQCSTVLQHIRTRPQQRPPPYSAKISWNSELKHESKKKVAFSKQISVSFTISRQDMTPNEVRCVWYSEQEYHKINRACLKQIQKLDRGEILKDKKYCARGLETKTFIASISQQMHRNLAIKVVLEEQDRQRREGIREPECVSSLYYSVSSSSQIWANVVALTDQRLADANENNDRRDGDNKSPSCHVDNPKASPRTSGHFLLDKSSNPSAPFPSSIPQAIILELARAA